MPITGLAGRSPPSKPAYDSPFGFPKQNLHANMFESMMGCPPLKNNMKPVPTNIFADIPVQLPEELFECILKQDNIVIERIVSNGHATPAGQWYDQAWDEWVILLQGQATLLFEKTQSLVRLAPGDYLLIPAHTRHRVEWTLPDFNTIWLAVHCQHV